MHKPDGLDEINKDNFRKVYSTLSLTDLCGIKNRNTARLNSMGIYTVTDFYEAPLSKLKVAFRSIAGYYWYLRLHGWEVDNVTFGRRSYGNSFALPQALSGAKLLSPILTKLVEKMGTRLRKAHYKVQGVHLAISFKDHSFWHKGSKTSRVLYDSRDIYKEAFALLAACPYVKPVAKVAVSSFNLIKANSSQLELFEDILRKESLINAVDKINERWGNFVIYSGRMLNTKNIVPDRIAFGGVKELEEFTMQS